ncbi:MAG: hypothetical protein ACRDOO_14655, partial [Actinomadura sp.]
MGSSDALPGLEAVRTPVRPEQGGPTADYAIEERLVAALPRPVRIAGVDEVGRGAWAGPVVVCAAVTDLSPPPA